MTRMRTCWLLCAIAALLVAQRGAASDTGTKEIDRFNQNLIDLHLKMDDTGILTLWEDDGVDLMPGEVPLIGKSAITAWLHSILPNLKGYKVIKQEMDFHDLRVHGDWATEWATEHQVVQPPDGTSPIETYGKASFVLHRVPSGEWKISQEMWNISPRPAAPPKP